MKIYLHYFTLLLVVLIPFSVKGQKPPTNDNCSAPITLRAINGYCSQAGEYNNINATASGLDKALEWPSAGNDVWFKFVANAYDINIDVKTGGGLGTLSNPLVAIYTVSNCTNFNQEIGKLYADANQGSYYKGGLVVGQTYYIRISGGNNSTGTFQLCVDNYFPPLQPGQDFSNASLLCSKDAFTQNKVSGSGLDNNEASGTCLSGSGEANSTWYKWIAANDGILTFTITPTSTSDDIDWVLFDLGPSNTPQKPNASNALRCAAGSGVTCSPSYYLTGLNLTSTDFNEQAGCGIGQDGFVRYVDAKQDHLYALLINNFTSTDNGFRLDFTGSTVEFLGPAPSFQAQNTPCDNNFSTRYVPDEIRPGYDFKWDFGEGAITRTSTKAGPVDVNYTGPGDRTVTLQVTSPLGCTSYRSYFFKDSGPLPAPTLADIPKTYCVGDTLVITPTNQPAGSEAVWTLPTGKEITTSGELVVPLTTDSLSGTYTLKYTAEPCSGSANTIEIKVLKKPIANFEIDPTPDQLYSAPIQFNFVNSSKNATGYLWNFGDGETSTAVNPSHTYTKSGRYVISLVSYNQQCADTLTLPVLKILEEGDVLVPNAFTPNGDGNNDQFNVLIANLKTYHIDIFNRYGSIVFSSDRIIDSWDGTYKGKPMPVGVYYFIISAVDLTGNKIFKKNSVTLIR
ncbi:MAG: gliding motility-associated C-terminal domain-containing protein [Bacteroidetes bacterium]|nr:gliding motility-associated C-terminal domain-containing protein [Bacteroidota bacterium]MBU1483499.1 gliding motility-associated C-terminal domain-containing protein [Bacteroidota bacterium]MBU2267829.1 gliding motility-associated C-terminal domain-containing protein [Bacteroidota bacterium]MBU2376741.1 gliding motility-associated C-terminal domain-containing protein [Bacteroidota bacterium]